MASHRTPFYPSYPSCPYTSPSSTRLPSDLFQPYKFTASYSAESSSKGQSKKEFTFPEYPKVHSFSLYDKDTKAKAKDTYNYKYLVSPVAFRKTHVSKFHENNRMAASKSPVRKDLKADPLKNVFPTSESRVQKPALLQLDSNSRDYSFIKELHEKFLVCKLCFKSFAKPKTLICLHSFCEDCLHKHKEKDPGILNRNRLLCPVCGVKTELPYGGVKRLPESHMISNLNQVLTNRINREMKAVSSTESFASRHSYHGSVVNSVYNFLEFEDASAEKSSSSVYVKHWCGICGKGNKPENESSTFDSERSDTEVIDKSSEAPFEQEGESGGVSVSECQNEMRKEATVECLDCSAKMLCDECAELHRSAEITSGHSLVAVELARKGKLQCEFHEKELIRYFCETCETCVCVLCAFNRHKSHKIVTFAEGIESQLKQMGGKFEVCKSTSSAIKEQLELINNFEGNIYTVENLIKKQTNELMAKLKEKEQHALDRLKTLTEDEKIVEFLEQKDKIETLLGSVDLTFKLIENVLSGKSVDIFLVKKILEEKMKDFLEWETKETPENVKEPMSFTPSKQEIQFGELIIDKFSSIEDRPSPGRASEDNLINSESKTSVESVKRSSSRKDDSDDKEESPSHPDMEGDKTLEENISFSDIGVQTTEKLDECKVEKNKMEDKNFVEVATNTDCIIQTFETPPLVLKACVSVGVITDDILKEDKATVTVSTSITTTYKDFIENLSPKVLKVNRGTMTVKEKPEKDTLKSDKMVDKATSPIKIAKVDKAVMASKAEVREHKEVFHRAGMHSKPKKIINEMFAESLLDSIHEDEAEEDENVPEQQNTGSTIFSHVKDSSKRISCVPKSRMLLKPLPNSSNEHSNKNRTNSAVVHPMNLPLRETIELPSSIQTFLSDQNLPTNRQLTYTNTNLPPSHLTSLPRPHVDTSTNTRSVSREDKATGTDSPPVVEKMAACISKLKTVRHRLECLHTLQHSNDSIDGGRNDGGRAGSEGVKSDESKTELPFDHLDPPTLINSIISNQASSDPSGGHLADAVTSQSTSDAESNGKRSTKTLCKNKSNVSQENSPLEKRPSTPGAHRRTKKGLPKLKDTSEQVSREGKTKVTNSNSSSYNSSESSCNNSPSIQRSLKLSLHRPLSSPVSRSNPFNPQKPPMALPKTPPTSARRNKPPSFFEQKIKPRLAELSDSLHSESSEDQEKLSDLPIKMTDVPPIDAAQSPFVFPKRASTIFKPHASSLHRRNRIESNQGLLKTPKERHKSPRPPKK